MGICDMNIFSTLTRYNVAWSEKSFRTLNSDELKEISGIKVTESEYGKSLCFSMVSGGVTYIPLHRDNESMPVDTVVDKNKVELVTLQRVGDADITKARVKE